MKKRIVLGLLFDGFHFYLSRNFRLQRLGDLDWLQRNFQIFDLATYVDEIAIFHVRRTMDITEFSAAFGDVTKKIFVPVSVGGGLKSIGEVDLLFRSGADRIMFSNAVWHNPQLISDVNEKYGSQATIAVANFEDSGSCLVVKNGAPPEQSPPSMRDFSRTVDGLGVGEVVLQSIDKDGTGQGFPLIQAKSEWGAKSVPLIAAGGFGSTAHVAACLEDSFFDAALTSNLLAFVGDGLSRAREEAGARGVDLARWSALDTFV